MRSISHNTSVNAGVMQALPKGIIYTIIDVLDNGAAGNLPCLATLTMAQSSNDFEKSKEPSMITPSQLGKKPVVRQLVVPDYDYEGQTRTGLFAMSYTTNSIQTFNHKGVPTDARSDNND
jgi:hypothetical protein